MSRLVVLVAAGAALAAAAAPALAAPLRTQSFQTPSGNIACFQSATLRCDIGEATFPIPRRPATCEQDWGRAFEMGRASRARRICVGDTTLNPNAPVLAYGRTWTRGAFTCTSRLSGLSCSNRTGHGWKLSRQGVALS